MPISKLNKPRSFMRGKPTICLTLGDPSGIGPEVLLKALTDSSLQNAANFLIIGDSSVINKTASACKISLPIKIIKDEETLDFKKHPINLLDCKCIAPGKFKFGRIDKVYGRCSMAYLKRTLNYIRRKKADALVTGPISKEAVNLAGYNITGHTEFLAALSHTKRFAMMLTGGPLRVVLVTTHRPLKEAILSLKSEKIYDSILLAHNWLVKYFGVAKPRIGVCALNPHAGEAGLFGYEESRLISPAVKRARRQNICIDGPIPADSMFYMAKNGKYDAIICMYHDQGLIPLKMLAKDTAVNVTLGLPFIRTSPGHGTAFDIAGKNKASPNSMKEAIKLAINLARHKE